MSQKDIKTLVIEADPDWPAKSVRPVSYRFGRDREFHVTERPGQPYAWSTGQDT